MRTVARTLQPLSASKKFWMVGIQAAKFTCIQGACCLKFPYCPFLPRHFFIKDNCVCHHIVKMLISERTRSYTCTRMQVQATSSGAYSYLTNGTNLRDLRDNLDSLRSHHTPSLRITIIQPGFPEHFRQLHVSCLGQTPSKQKISGESTNLQIVEQS